MPVSVILWFKVIVSVSCDLLYFRFRERSELTPYMQTLNYMDYTADQIKDLMFDRSKFRADRQASKI